MKTLTLGRTGITTPQNAFGALPIQRVEKAEAVKLLRKAYDGGMTYFDTARAYTDSEEKMGAAFEGMRDKIFIATKTHAQDAKTFWEHLETSLTNLKTDHLDLYQLHCVPKCYKPDDGSGLYEAMLKAKEQGKILHIGITAHKIGVAEEIVESGLYETLQFPFSYLSTDRDIALVKKCEEAGMGFIAMKGLSGGLLTNSKACMAFMSQYPALPIWGIQRDAELDECGSGGTARGPYRIPSRNQAVRGLDPRRNQIDARMPRCTRTSLQGRCAYLPDGRHDQDGRACPGRMRANRERRRMGQRERTGDDGGRRRVRRRIRRCTRRASHGGRGCGKGQPSAVRQVVESADHMPGAALRHVSPQPYDSNEGSSTISLFSPSGK